MELLYSVGRVCRVYDRGNPCKIQLLLNETPLYPAEAPMVLDTMTPVLFTLTCTVRAGDKIRLRLDSMGNIHADGVMKYRQQIGYLNIVGDKN